MRFCSLISTLEQKKDKSAATINEWGELTKCLINFSAALYLWKASSLYMWVSDAC